MIEVLFLRKFVGEVSGPNSLVLSGELRSILVVLLRLNREDKECSFWFLPFEVSGKSPTNSSLSSKEDKDSLLYSSLIDVDMLGLFILELVYVFCLFDLELFGIMIESDTGLLTLLSGVFNSFFAFDFLIFDSSNFYSFKEAFLFGVT